MTLPSKFYYNGIWRNMTSTSAHSFCILAVVTSLISAGILNATIDIDAFAKKIKTSLSDRTNGRGSSNSSFKASSTKQRELSQLCHSQLKLLQIASL